MDVDPERENVPDGQIPVYGTRLWDRLTPEEILKLRREQLSWTLSQFLHGEQGALLASAQIVDAAPWIKAKFYGATQVVDEARHTERQVRRKGPAVDAGGVPESVVGTSRHGKATPRYCCRTASIE